MTEAPPTLSPREAVQRWLDRQRVDKRAATVSAYWYRLKHFIEWTEAEEIDSVAELTGWTLDSYETYRRGAGLEAITLNNELGTLQQFLEYCARVELVDEDLPEKVDVPVVPAQDQVSETRLDETSAERLLTHYRTGGEGANRRGHAFIELAWYTGARVGALRGLDVDDVDTDRGYIRFRHRPESDTPLKNGQNGERTVTVPPEATAVVERYLEDRHDVVDDFGRHPLFTTVQGRAATTTLREDCYFGTVPCRYRDCPHGTHPQECEWYRHRSASGCPSSRSPHQIRTGSITWHRTREVPVEIVSERADASPEVIRRHYDQPDSNERIERQAPYLSNLRFSDDET
jgi:site-specific recombinase XerD